MPSETVDRIEEELDHPDRMNAIRQKAGETAVEEVEEYNLTKLLPLYLQGIQQYVSGRHFLYCRRTQKVWCQDK